MFGNIGFGEIIVAGVLGLLIFGPERLPKAAGDAARLIRQLRALATTAMDDLKSELPDDLAELDLRSLHPRTMLRDAVLGEPARPGPIVRDGVVPEPTRPAPASRHDGDERPAD